tara:strand:- start:2854 stop:3216 length:363 start_codon:yes stop_codon:yes gene_type:complete
MNVQLQIRRKGGGDVSVDDCATLSTPISEAFDNSQLLKNPYILEISSPGINDLLTSPRDFETFQGFPVEVIFKDENQNKQTKIGLLHEKSEDHLKLNLKGRISIFPMRNVMKVRLTSLEG